MNWLDGSSVNYVNWENKTAETNEKCSVILSSTGMWSKVDCARSQSRVVCKAPLGTAALILAENFVETVSRNFWFIG